MFVYQSFSGVDFAEGPVLRVLSAEMDHSPRGDTELLCRTDVTSEY